MLEIEFAVFIGMLCMAFLLWVLGSFVVSSMAVDYLQTCDMERRAQARVQQTRPSGRPRRAQDLLYLHEVAVHRRLQLGKTGHARLLVVMAAAWTTYTVAVVGFAVWAQS